MSDFSLALNEDQLTLQKWLHEFAVDVMRPNAEEWDETEGATEGGTASNVEGNANASSFGGPKSGLKTCLKGAAATETKEGKDPPDLDKNDVTDCTTMT